MKVYSLNLLATTKLNIEIYMKQNNCLYGTKPQNRLMETLIYSTVHIFFFFYGLEIETGGQRRREEDESKKKLHKRSHQRRRRVSLTYENKKFDLRIGNRGDLVVFIVEQLPVAAGQRIPGEESKGFSLQGGQLLHFILLFFHVCPRPCLPFSCSTAMS